MTIIKNIFLYALSQLIETTQGHNLVQTRSTSGHSANMLPIHYWVVEFTIRILEYWMLMCIKTAEYAFVGERYKATSAHWGRARKQFGVKKRPGNVHVQYPQRLHSCAWTEALTASVSPSWTNDCEAVTSLLQSSQERTSINIFVHKNDTGDRWTGAGTLFFFN